MADKPYDIHQLAGSATSGEIAYLRPPGLPPARGGPAGYSGLPPARGEPAGYTGGTAPGSPVTDRR